jgi:hypothetical protein
MYIIPGNADKVIENYFDLGPGVQQMDSLYFMGRKERLHFIRGPYENELKGDFTGEEDCVLIVVRKHGSEALERRAFQVLGSTRVEALEALYSDNQEILARVLWAAWDVYEPGIEPSSEYINATVKGLVDFHLAPFVRDRPEWSWEDI